MEHVRLLALATHMRSEWAVDPKELEQLKVIQKALDEVPGHAMPTAATAGCLLSGRVHLANAAAALQDLVTKVGLALQPTPEEDQALQDAVSLLQQERERLHVAHLRLLEPGKVPVS